MDSTAGGFDEAQLVLHAAWMRRLAGSLIGEGSADDVAQEAALEALRHPPHHGLNLPGWLGRVVRSSAFSFKRTEGRRVQREAFVARPDSLPSAGELAAEAEIQHELSEALLGLKEPYRSALILRFYHDLKPSEIAKRSGEKPGTVRSRLSRGLELLRERLDAHCGGREAWSTVLAPLATWDTAGRSGAAATAGTSAGLVLGLKAVLACALAAGVVAALYIGFNGSKERLEGEPAVRAPETAGAVAPARAAREEGALAPPAVGGDRVALATTPAARELWSVRVVARDPEGGPVAGVSVTLFPYAENKTVLATAVTDERGSARLVPADGAMSRARLTWEAAGWIGGKRHFDDLTGELELHLGWTATLTGIVSDAETGEPLEGVEVSESKSTVLTGPDGHYELPGVLVGGSSTIWFHKDAYAVGETSLVVRDRDEALDFALERGFALDFAFIDSETGLPIPDVGVAHGKILGGQPFALASESGIVSLRTSVGAQLSFTASAEDYSAWALTWNVQAKPPQTVVRVPLVRKAWIEGQVTDTSGQAVEGAFLTAECPDHGAVLSFSPEQQAELGFPGWCCYLLPWELNTRSDASGRYRLPAVACGHAWRLTAGGPTFARTQLTLEGPIEPGEIRRRDVKLAHEATIRGRVLENGQPLAAASVQWMDALGVNRGIVSCDTEGRYELKKVAPGEVTVALRCQGAFDPLEVAQVEVLPGQVLDQDFVRTLTLAKISGIVRTARGLPVRGASVTARLVSGSGSLGRAFPTKTDAEGGYVVSVADGCLYDLRASSGALSRDEASVPAGATGVDLTLPEPVKLSLRLVDALTGDPVPVTSSGGLYWRFVGEEPFQDVNVTPARDGRLDLFVEAGQVDVLVHLPEAGYAPHLVEGLSVSADGAGAIETVELERGLEAHLRFASEDVAPLDLKTGHALFLVEEAQLGQIEGPLDEEIGAPPLYTVGGLWMRLSTPALLRQMVKPGVDGAARVPGLGPGRYHLHVYPDDFVFEPAVIDLRRSSAEPVEIRWRRR